MSRIRRYIAGLSRYFRWDIYARLLPYVRPYKWPMALVLAIQLIYTGLGLLEPWPMKLLIDNGISRHPLPEWLTQIFPFLASGGGATIIISAVASILVLRVLYILLDVGGDYVKQGVNTGMILDFKTDLFNHLQRLSFSYHDRTTVSDSIYRVNNDTSFISVMIWSNFRALLKSSLTLVAILWILVKLDWKLALLALASTPLQYLIIGFYNKLFKDKWRRVEELETAAQTVMQESLSCLRVVKAFGQEEREQQRFKQSSLTAIRAKIVLGFQEHLFSYGQYFISRLGQTLVLLVGGLHALNGQLTIGELLVILAYVDQLYEPLQGIGDALTNMQSSLVGAERAIEVLDIEPDIQDRPGAKSPKHLSGAIEFEGINFTYGDEHPVLREISFTAQPGDVVAIVGPTGAGKTTLASLLVRFYDPSAGCIKLDGHDLRDLTLKTLRDNIALVSQEPILFSGSIRENIAYGRPDASQEEIISAAKAANAHDFIMALPEGYESQIGERGVRLSGGERQRLSLARAFLKDAPVLILDEPTSSLDSRTEWMILEALERLMAGRTTFIIAHRLSTIHYADQIIVIEKGSIVERGTHNNLVKQNGLYAQLYRIQSGALRRERAQADQNRESEEVEV
jgi:ABC-type multidrug transport system fused ATPase/permease subunit